MASDENGALLVGQKTFFIGLTDQDRMAVSITTGRLGVEHYAVSLQCRFDDSDTWTDVRRYDCSHHVVHTHVLRRNGQPRIVSYPLLHFDEGLNLAQGEVRENWVRYREEFESAW